jgi:hypothetical protein
MRLEESPLPNKKWRAIFKNGKHTDFGDSNYSDFTQHRDPARRKAYWLRHFKDLETNDPTRAGFLSLFILWTYPTTERAVKEYNKLFDV